MLFFYRTFLSNPDTGEIEPAGFTGKGLGAYLTNVRVRLQPSHTLPARIEIFYFTNVTAYRSSTGLGHPSGYAVLVNETFHVSSQTENAVTQQDAIDFVSNKTFAWKYWMQENPGEHRTFHRFTSLYNVSANAVRTDKVHVESFSSENNANTTTDDSAGDFEASKSVCGAYANLNPPP
ncbi:MAG: hypothetical protein MHM6MM_009561, partial [Cercozoa sp. M6MM]